MAVPIPAAIGGATGLALLEYIRRRMMSDSGAAPPATPATAPAVVPPAPTLYDQPPAPTVTTTTTRPRGAGTSTPALSATPPATPDEAANTTTGQSGPPTTQQAPQEGESPWERLARFGFAMAASPNPSLFGQIGEAGLLMQRGDRERRQDNLREREVDNTNEFRQAQLRLAQAEQEWARDPSNPRNVAQLADARYRLAMASRAASGGGGGGGSEGSAVPLRGPDGNLMFFYPRTGRVVQAPEGAGRPDEPSRAEALFQRDVNQFVQAHRQNPRYLAEPDRLLDDANNYASRRQQTANRPGAPTAPNPDTPAQNRVRIPFNPPQ